LVFGRRDWPAPSGKLGQHQLVRVANQLCQLAPIQPLADALILDPHGTGEMGRRDDAVALD